MNISDTVADLLLYAEKEELTFPEDRVYLSNALCAALRVDDFAPARPPRLRPLEEMLDELCDFAGETGVADCSSVVYRDLFDTALMGILTPAPHEVIAAFRERCRRSPAEATDAFYHLCTACNYIRAYRIAKDVRWKYASAYGELDITVNLSKPEKDPKAIAAALVAPQSGYPKCLLCHENEGYAGSVSKPARQNLRQIPLNLEGKTWYLQYSPYVYYNEHCIVLSAAHTPMKIDGGTFRRALAFVEQLPHYFIGSNADLPIVGGSILTHDHMQGGRYRFPMEKAPVEIPAALAGFADVKAGIVRWPMSVLRLTGPDRERLAQAAEKILAVWRGYSDPSAFVFAETDGVPHNTVTPIARRRGELFELDLVLRNNITTAEHPLGVFHPHTALHHIKKENIGLIEVMGLAVLPSRLKTEMARMEQAIAAQEDISRVPELACHAAWLEEVKGRHDFSRENAADVLKAEVGAVFEKVLEDSGVFKCTAAGRAAMLRFLAAVNDR